MAVFVGTAGFSYADWKGNFYEKNTSSSEMLGEYSKHFPVVEINSTFYNIPRPESILSMARRTPTDFQFTVKANREMTHEIGKKEDVFERFRRTMRPLADHGKLGCLLAQFPWSFKSLPENFEYLRFLSAELEGFDTVVEFRNDSWESEETFEFLRELGLGYCCVDEPKLKKLPHGRVEVTSDIGYFRFHGRNYETWWDRDRESWERYNYKYSDEELESLLPGVVDIARKTKRVYVVFNNHYKGQAPANAKTFEMMLRNELGEEVRSTSLSGVTGFDGEGKLFDTF
ncbi:MAG: DUF72 domain-containing protein [Actinomycetota bacterium]|nr:DUF72 domain-containing protein [Actinomycetota bacterium]